MLAAKKKKQIGVKSILISQPKPETERSPYFDLAKKHNIKIDFRPFIQVEGIPAKDFRKDRINLHDYPIVIFTSRNSIDHFFRVCEELRLKMSQETKYICMSEAIALYLQKYILYRKRKVFFGDGTMKNLQELLTKHKGKDKVLLPCSDIAKDDIPNFLSDNDFDWDKAVIYRTVASDLSDLDDITYDMIVFFSPAGVKSLFQNFPNFKQNNTRIAAFGPTTSKMVTDSGLRLDLQAPVPQAPSMAMAIEKYLKKINKR
jgi:uroporphyrinogen-III synthase